MKVLQFNRSFLHTKVQMPNSVFPIWTYVVALIFHLFHGSLLSSCSFSVSLDSISSLCFSISRKLSWKSVFFLLLEFMIDVITLEVVGPLSSKSTSWFDVQWGWVEVTNQQECFFPLDQDIVASSLLHRSNYQLVSFFFMNGLREKQFEEWPCTGLFFYWKARISWFSNRNLLQFNPKLITQRFVFFYSFSCNKEKFKLIILYESMYWS